MTWAPAIPPGATATAAAPFSNDHAKRAVVSVPSSSTSTRKRPSGSCPSGSPGGAHGSVGPAGRRAADREQTRSTRRRASRASQASLQVGSRRRCHANAVADPGARGAVDGRERGVDERAVLGRLDVLLEHVQVDERVAGRGEGGGAIWSWSE